MNTMNFIKFIVLIISLVLLERCGCEENRLVRRQIRTCYSKDGCNTTCPEIPNSKCDFVQEDDMVYCGCIHCNYDRRQRKCVGQCKDRVHTQCISRSFFPLCNDDCTCFKCNTTYDSRDNAICSGKCLNSGLVCKPKKFMTMIGPRFSCYCQSRSARVEDQEVCRYRPTLGRCEGRCDGGGKCSNPDGGFQCTCAAAPVAVFVPGPLEASP